MRTASAFLPVLLIGCCSIINGTSDEITVTSEPTGARLFVVGQGTRITTSRITENFSVTELPGAVQFTAKTPATFNLSKNGNWIIYVAKNGFETEVVTVSRSLDHVYWLNIFNAFLGALVDWGTGAWKKADRTEYHFKLDPVEK